MCVVSLFWCRRMSLPFFFFFFSPLLVMYTLHPMTAFYFVVLLTRFVSQFAQNDQNAEHPVCHSNRARTPQIWITIRRDNIIDLQYTTHYSHITQINLNKQFNYDYLSCFRAKSLRKHFDANFGSIYNISIFVDDKI